MSLGVAVVVLPEFKDHMYTARTTYFSFWFSLSSVLQAQSSGPLHNPPAEADVVAVTLWHCDDAMPEALID